MIKPCDIPVPRSLRALNCRVWAFGAIAVLLLLSGARSSRAAGCHAQDRPALDYTLSWEKNQKSEPGSRPIAAAPRVLTHPPCGGEIPLASTSSTLPTFAVLVDLSVIASPSDRDTPLIRTPTGHSQPPSVRLDRPPRPL